MDISVTGDAAPGLEVTVQPIVVGVAAQPANVIEVQAVQTAVQVQAGGVTVVQVPGERGPAGAGGSGSGSPATQLDLTGTRYWYLLYSDHISRVDNAVSPSLVQRAESTDWAGRAGLTYV